MMGQVEEVLDTVVNPPTKKQGLISLGLVSLLILSLYWPMRGDLAEAKANAVETRDTIQTIQVRLGEIVGYLKSMDKMKKAELEGKKIFIYDTLTVVDTVFVDINKDSL